MKDNDNATDEIGRDAFESLLFLGYASAVTPFSKAAQTYFENDRYVDEYLDFSDVRFCKDTL